MSVRPVKLPDSGVFRLYTMEDPTSPVEVFPVSCYPFHSQGESFQDAELDIEPEGSLTFDLEVRVPMDERVHEDAVVLETDYESRSFPVTYQVPFLPYPFHPPL